MERGVIVDILKRIGACILGALEGWFVCWLIGSGGQEVSNAMTVVGVIIGGVLGFCWPMSTVIIIVAILALSYRGRRRDD